MPLSGMAADSDQTGAGGLLSLATNLYNILQTKDSKMGDLLQMMEPIKGQESVVEEASDKVKSVIPAFFFYGALSSSILMCFTCI
jgi:hypothetical protein